MSSDTATLSRKVVSRACTALRLFSLIFIVKLSFCRLLISCEMSPRLDRNPCSICDSAPNHDTTTSMNMNPSTHKATTAAAGPTSAKGPRTHLLHTA